MLKYIIARLRWGKLSQEDKEILKTMSASQVFSRPYLKPKLHTHY